MNTQARTITISLSPELQGRIRIRTSQHGLSRSEYVRTLIERDFEGDATHGQIESRLAFIEIGIDALLKHHANPELRQVVHATHRDRLQRRTGQEVEA